MTATHRTLPPQLHPFLLLFPLGLLLAFSACDLQEDFVRGNGVQLGFSTDTLSFDTVFVARGSATRSFRVYNRSDQPIKIDRIYVAGTTGVTFNINVDGSQGPIVEDAVIWDNDSIHVFVEVTVDPTAPTDQSPFVIEDRLIFETGDNSKSVQLLANGQNAIYLNDFNRAVPVELVCNGGEVRWTKDLPYVIYGEIFIPCPLVMEAGTRVYIHGGIARNEVFGVFNDGILYTLPGGSIRAEGTLEEPVIIQTDRLEESFQEQPGQYFGIILGPESRGNTFNHTKLFHGIYGILADSLSEVSITNTEIAYVATSAVGARRATVRLDNSLIHDVFSNAVQFTQGGTLEMNHTTVASYGVDASALALQNFQCYDADCVINVAFPITARIRNSLLVGSRRDEIILVDGFERMEPTFFDVQISNSVVEVSDLIDGMNTQYADFFTTICSGCYDLQTNDPLFLSVQEDNYGLDTLSVAKDLGQPLPGLELDLIGTPRDALPDAGALERRE